MSEILAKSCTQQPTPPVCGWAQDRVLHRNKIYTHGGPSCNKSSS